MHIINIGTPLHENKVSTITHTDFFSEITFIDAEMIFWDVESSYKHFQGSENWDNVCKKSDFDYMKTLIMNRKNELNEFFKMGRTLIITSPIFHKYSYSFEDSKGSSYHDFIECLEIIKPQIDKVSGKNIEPSKKDIFIDFYNKTKQFFSYSFKIINSKGQALMYIKDTKWIFRSYCATYSGHIVPHKTDVISRPNLHINL